MPDAIVQQLGQNSAAKICRSYNKILDEVLDNRSFLLIDFVPRQLLIGFVMQF